MFFLLLDLVSVVSSSLGGISHTSVLPEARSVGAVLQELWAEPFNSHLFNCLTLYLTLIYCFMLRKKYIL